MEQSTPHTAPEVVAAPKRPRSYATRPQCSAKSKHTQERCQNWVCDGRTVCKYHGGRSLRGIDSPVLTTGIRSKYMTPDLAKRYAESLTRQDLLSLREPIALIDTRLNELISKVNTGEGGASWVSASKAAKNLRDALYGPPSPTKGAEVDAAMKALERVTDSGTDQQKLWREIIEVSRHQERLIASERRALVEANQVITVQQAMLLVNQVIQAVGKNVTDRKALIGIAQDVERIIHHHGSGVDGPLRPGGSQPEP